MMRLFLAAILLCGCAAARPRAWNDNAHLALNTAAHALVAVDAVAADQYAKAAAPLATDEALDALDAKYRGVRDAERAMAASLRGAETALGQYETIHAQPEACHVRAMLNAAVQDASALAAALRALGITQNATLEDATKAAAQVAALIPGSCSETP